MPTIVTAVAHVGPAATPLVSDDCVGIYTERLIFMNLVSTRSHGVRFINGAVCELLVDLRKHLLKLNDVIGFLACSIASDVAIADISQ